MFNKQDTVTTLVVVALGLGALQLLGSVKFEANPSLASQNLGAINATLTSPAPSIKVSLDPNSPAGHALYWGETQNPNENPGSQVSRFRFQASGDSFFIQTLTLQVLNAFATQTIKQVYVSYSPKDQQPITVPGVLSTSGVLSLNFTGKTGPYVSKDTPTTILVAVDLKTKQEGNLNVDNNDVPLNLNLTPYYNGSGRAGFKAVGENTGTILDGYAITTVRPPTMYIYRVFPEFNIVGMSYPYSLTGTPTVLKFTVTAKGAPDAPLIFNSLSNFVKFAITASGENSSIPTTYEVRSYDPTTDTDTLYDRGDLKNIKSNGDQFLNFAFANVPGTIVPGSPKTFRVILTNPSNNYAKTNNLATGRAADYFGLTLPDNQNDLIRWTAISGYLTRSYAGILRLLPLHGPIFQR